MKKLILVAALSALGAQWAEAGVLRFVGKKAAAAVTAATKASKAGVKAAGKVIW